MNTPTSNHIPEKPTATASRTDIGVGCSGWLGWIVCVFSPRWRVVVSGPLTQHLMFRGVKVGENLAEYWVEENRCGKRRAFVKESWGTYQIAMSRLGDKPNAAVRDAGDGSNTQRGDCPRSL